jgi:NitT/TauT family transport system substrate-binding protein
MRERKGFDPSGTAARDVRRDPRLWLMVVVALFLLAACGGEEDGQAGDTPTDDAAETEPDVAATEPEVAATATEDGGEPEEAEACEEPERLVYGYGAQSPTVAQAGYITVPDVAGYWEEECIITEMQFFQGSTVMVQAAEAGQIDLGVGSLNSTIAAVGAGANVKVFFNQLHRNNVIPHVLEDSDIQEPEDLIGRTVGVASLESGSLPYIRAYIHFAGGDPETDVEFVPVGTGAPAAEALTTGRVDVLGLWDDPHAVIREQLGVPIRPITHPAIDGPDVGFFNGFTTGRDIAEMREQFVGFARGIAKGNVFTAENPECAVRLHWQHFPDSLPSGVSEEEAMESALLVLRTRQDFIAPVEGLWGNATTEQVQGQIELLKAAGLLPPDVDVTVDQVWTDEIVEEANDFDQEAVKEDARACRGLES